MTSQYMLVTIITVDSLSYHIMLPESAMTCQAQANATNIRSRSLFRRPEDQETRYSHGNTIQKAVIISRKLCSDYTRTAKKERLSGQISTRL